jgi:molybdopterin-containing oxidoreductase family iron-sulfur binding subunit
MTAIDLNLVGAKGAIVEEAEGKWGMVIDQDICTGCQACVTACAMENNIAFVGEEDAGYGRSMHWIRVERFWEGTYPHVKMTDYQPMLCQQCGSAPCEPVCPAFATVHSQAEQVNLQVYNRCVGTRYCANNCPYQVRSFNWRDYNDERIHSAIAMLKNQYNPDVTVRRRGIMEKCTFCIQRIRRGAETAKAEGRAVEDGEVVPACAQACPSNALVFGDKYDEASRIAKMLPGERQFKLLESLGTEPAVYYLKGGETHVGD